MKHIVYAICVPLVFAFAAVPSSGHALLFPPSPSELPWNAFNFLSEVQAAFGDFRNAKNRYPSTWEEAWPFLSKRATGYRSLSDAYSLRDGRFLHVKDKEMKPAYVYVIDSASADSYAVHSESARKDTEYRIVHDCDKILWYFKSEKDELAKLSAVEKDYSKKSVFRKYLGQGDPLYLGDWKFDHPAAMDLLIRFLREDKLHFYTKHGVVSAMQNSAHLARYRGKRAELESILAGEKKRKVSKEDEASQTLYVEGLGKVIESLR